MANVSRLEKEFDQIHIDNTMSISQDTEKKRLNNQFVRPERYKKKYHHEPMKKNNKEVRRGKKEKEKEEWRVNKGKQSFADAVKRPSQEKWKGLIVETQQQVLPWMVNSVVGHMSADLNYNQLCEEFVKGE